MHAAHLRFIKRAEGAQPGTCASAGGATYDTKAINMDEKLETKERILDITREICPMTFVRTRLALDRMEPGEILLIKLKGAEPTANVPRSARELGHEVLSQATAEDGTVLLRLRRGGR